MLYARYIYSKKSRSCASLTPIRRERWRGTTPCDAGCYPSRNCFLFSLALLPGLLSSGMELYTASTGLLNVLFDPARTSSYAVRDAAFNDAYETDLTYWEFLEQREGQLDGAGKPRRGLEIFSLAMVGGGNVHAPPLYAGTCPFVYALSCMPSADWFGC